MTALSLVATADTAVIYGRQSKAKKASIEQQIDIGNRVIAENGWRPGGVYQDGTSASRFATKKRDDWDRLVSDLKAGRFQVLVLWETSRGDRDLPTWVTLLAECRERGILIYVVTAERLYDCRIARDWKTLVEDGLDSAYESEKTSLRMRRNTDDFAATGRPHGMVAYGYKRVRTFDNAGRMIDSRDEIVPEQAEVIRETAKRLLAGESMRSIVKTLNDRHEPTPKPWKGVPYAVPLWSSTQLRQVMLRDRNAGLRRHRGKAIGRAAWDPIYDQGTHDRVVALLTDPSRKAAATGALGATRKHLLTGLARCGVCGGPLRATSPGTYKRKSFPARYQCKECFRIGRKKESVEKIVEGVVIERLKQSDAIRAIASGRPERAEELYGLIAEAQAQMDRAVDKMLEGSWTETQVDRLNARLLPQVEEWRAEMAACAPRDGLLDLIGQDAEQRWAKASLDIKRTVIETLMTVTVLPTVPGRKFSADEIRIDWKHAQRDGALAVVEPAP